MTRWLQVGAAAAVGIAASLLLASWVAQLRWRRATERAVDRLGAGMIDAGRRRSPATHGSGVPSPVARYFAFALGSERRLIRSARLTQEGTFLLRPGAAESRFTAVDYVATSPPGLIWDASIRMAPFLSVRVRDSYLEGVGTMHAALGALLPIAQESGSPEIASAALQRYLAETPWVPTALFPSAMLHWSAIDNNSARATLTDRGITASIDFHLGPDGEITGTSADRYRSVEGQQVLTPWIGSCGQYRRVAGMMVPERAEVAWDLPEGRHTYWRGRITDVTNQKVP